MTLANIISMSRIVLVPILLVILLTKLQNKEIIAFIIFVIAALSDAVDGYIARKFNQVTELGKFLDPLADKLLVAGALLALVHLDLVETWVASIIILRALLITGFRFYFLMKDNSFSASWPAKYKTAFQVTAIAILIICKKLPFPETFFQIGTIVLYAATLLTVYSGIEYMFKFIRISEEK